MDELSGKKRPKKLEDIFREGMEEAEMAPPDQLWSRIERDLNIKEAGFYKERLLWYQRLAAACVVLVVFAGVYLFFDARQEQQAPVVAHQNPRQEPGVVATRPAELARTARPGQISREASQQQHDMILPEAPVVAQVGVAQDPMTQSTNAISRRAAVGGAGKAVAGNTADEAAVLINTVAAARPGNKTIPDTARSANDAGTVPPAISGGSLLAAVPPSFERPAGPGGIPDSLAPMLAQNGIGRVGALADSIPGRVAETRVTLATAAGMAEEAKPNKTKPGSRWRFGGKYASQYFDQNIALNYKQTAPASRSMLPNAMLPYASTGASSYAEALKEFDKETNSGFSFNTGISAAYQLNNHLDLETGLGYTQNVATTNTSYIFNNAQIGSHFTADFARSSGALNASLVAPGIPSTAFLATLAGGSTLNQTAVTKTPAFDTRYRYRLIGIPVKISYQTSRAKSFYFASMGMLTNLLVQANILTDSERVPDLKYAANTEDSPFRNWQFAAVASAGRGFEITKGLQIKAGVEATQYLTNLTIHPDYLSGKQRKPYTIGLLLSSSYRFNK